MNSFSSLRQKLLGMALVVAVSGGNTIAAPAAEPASGKTVDPSKVSPTELYHHVYKLVADRFYDSTYNGQKWERWEHRYDKHLKTLADARKAIETMLASLGDRYTRYLDPTAFEQETDMIQAQLTGIGIQMGLDKTHKLVVIAPIEGSPAARAGLMPMDEIAEIGDTATSTLSVEQASKMIRGPIGTPVTLTIVRNREKKKYTIIRDQIQIRSVQTAKMLTDEIGYIRLSTFMSQRANEEIKEALVTLTPARGIILDLRNNPGGLVNNAVDICSMFMDGGIIVSTVDRDDRFMSQRAYGKPISHQEIVVLINGGSASASEITSGALQDAKRAELVGEKSFGKGLVQSITRLEDNSGVNMTIARYLTPNNNDIHKKGIVPDYEVSLKKEDYDKGEGPWWLEPPGATPGAHRQPDDMKDRQLSKAVEVLKHKLQNASSPKPFALKLNPFPNDYPSGFGSVPRDR